MVVLTKREINTIDEVAHDFIGLYCAYFIQLFKESECCGTATVLLNPTKTSAIFSLKKGKERAAIDFLKQYCMRPFLPPVYLKNKLLEKSFVGVEVGSSHSIECYKRIFSYFDSKVVELNIMLKNLETSNKITFEFSKHKIPKSW